MIKILVMSDSHGLTSKVEEVLNKHFDVDYKIHLGDSQMSYSWLKKRFDYFVGGNCDTFSWTRKDLEEEIFEVKGMKIFICHGHLHINDVWKEQDTPGVDILKVAKRNNCILAMYGHMHTLVWKKFGNVYVLNPGSLRYSRGSEKESYVILEIYSKDNIICKPFFV